MGCISAATDYFTPGDMARDLGLITEVEAAASKGIAAGNRIFGLGASLSSAAVSTGITNTQEAKNRAKSRSFKKQRTNRRTLRTVKKMAVKIKNKVSRTVKKIRKTVKKLVRSIFRLFRKKRRRKAW